MNLRPSGYEPDELPDCSTPRYFCWGTCLVYHILPLNASIIFRKPGLFSTEQDPALAFSSGGPQEILTFRLCTSTINSGCYRARGKRTGRFPGPNNPTGRIESRWKILKKPWIPSSPSARGGALSTPGARSTAAWPTPGTTARWGWSLRTT